MATPQATRWPQYVGTAASTAGSRRPAVLWSELARGNPSYVMALALLGGRLRSVLQAAWRCACAAFAPLLLLPRSALLTEKRLWRTCRRVLLGSGWLANSARRQHPGATVATAGRLTLRRWHFVLAAYLSVKVLRAGAAALRSLLNKAERRERQRVMDQLRAATSYEEWAAAAVALDELNQRGCQEAAAKPKMVGCEDGCRVIRLWVWVGDRERQSFQGACMHTLGSKTPPTLTPIRYLIPSVPPPTPRRLQRRSQQELMWRAADLSRLRESNSIFALQSALRMEYNRAAGRATSRWVGCWDDVYLTMLLHPS